MTDKGRAGVDGGPGEWLPISQMPPPGMRPGRVFVIVEGSKYHTGILWRRQEAGIAATHNEGFDEKDIAWIEKRGDMDGGSGEVTHWLPINLPRYPSVAPCSKPEVKHD